VAVFGSYLTTRDRINDLDIAILLKPKIEGEELSRTIMNKAKEAGRRFNSFVDMIGWPEIETWRFLKRRSRTIELHEWAELAHALAAGKNIEHKILFEAADGPCD
jgi:hypothetical protein